MDRFNEKNLIILSMVFVILFTVTGSYGEVNKDLKYISRLDVKEDIDRNEYKKLKAFYKELEEEHKGFLVDTYNFERVKGKRRYELSKDNLGLAGRVIGLSENYFRENPKYSTSNRFILDQIVRNQNTLNIVVPEKYSILEENLKENYREYIYRNNVLKNNMEGIYDPRTEEDFDVNIIYIKENTKYLSYNEKYEYILDPIVVVIQDNLSQLELISKFKRGIYYNNSNISNLEMKEKIRERGLETVITDLVNVEGVFINNRDRLIVKRFSIGALAVLVGFLIVKLYEHFDLKPNKYDYLT